MLVATTALKTLNRYQAKYLFSEGNKRKVVLFPGNGIGPEISQSVVEIFNSLNVPIEWEYHQIHTKGQTAEGDLIST
jgi:isocitrate dehydrogenase (NAD+)